MRVGVFVVEQEFPPTLGSQQQSGDSISVVVQYGFVHCCVELVRQTVVASAEQTAVVVVCTRGEQELDVRPVDAIFV